MASAYDGASPEPEDISDKSAIKKASGASGAAGETRRSFLKGVVGGAVVAGVAAGAAGYYLRSPTVSPTQTTESNSVSNTSTLTNPNLGKQLLVGSGFPETG